QFLVEQGLVAGLDLAAADEEPLATLPVELNAILAAAGADDLHPVGIGEDHLEVGMAVVSVVPLRWRRAAALDVDRTAVVHVEGPLGNIIVMGAPVSHLAAGVRIPPAELIVAVRVDLLRLFPRSA